MTKNGCIFYKKENGKKMATGYYHQGNVYEFEISRDMNIYLKDGANKKAIGKKFYEFEINEDMDIYLNDASKKEQFEKGLVPSIIILGNLKNGMLHGPVYILSYDFELIKKADYIYGMDKLMLQEKLFFYDFSLTKEYSILNDSIKRFLCMFDMQN